ncbi:MAG: DUF2852 domain-containing protein [Pseudomonadota bacterium]
MMTQSATYTDRRQSWLRPAWTPATIGLMVLGFMIAWPLGLAMLAYIIWGDRLDDVKHEMRRGFGRFKREMDMNGFSNQRETGNVAFDEFRKSEIQRLEEERRKLDAMVEEFDEHLRNLRRAKDQEEFDAFMRSRHNHNGEHPTGDAPA